MIPAHSILKVLMVVISVLLGCALLTSCSQPVASTPAKTDGWQLIGVVGFHQQ